jgi:putative Mn2+ efflux pump MntP
MQLAFRIMGIAARLLFVLGAVCLLLGAYLANKTLEFTGTAVQATGQVVRYLESRAGDKTLYRPMVRFTTSSGDIVTIAGQLSSGSQRFEIGAEVPVVYPFGMPMQARLSTFTDNWLSATIAGAVGLVALIAGIFIRRAVKREVSRGGA